MKTDSKGIALINELLADPDNFYNEGRSYDLLQRYFKGFSIETLRPLLLNEQTLVKRVAIWIVSELGKGGCGLIDAVLPLINFDDRNVKYYALEIVTICSAEKNANQFIHVVRGLHDNDSGIRKLTMPLVTNADDVQLKAAMSGMKRDEPFGDIHIFGLNAMLTSNNYDKESVIEMLEDVQPLIRKYGAMVSAKLYSKFPELLRHAALSEDKEVKDFSLLYLDYQSIWQD